MDLFHVIDDSFIILRSRGVYRQAKLYRRGDGIYAGHGTGFVKIVNNHGTSHPKISWIDYDGAGIEKASLAPKWVGLPATKKRGKKNGASIRK